MKTDLHKGHGGMRLMFWCGGCETHHAVPVKSGSGPSTADERGWTWNGDREAPTLTPSLNTTYNGADAGQDRGDGKKAPPAVCHLYLTGGILNYLSDTTHSLAGQQVPLEDLP